MLKDSTKLREKCVIKFCQNRLTKMYHLLSNAWSQISTVSAIKQYCLSVNVSLGGGQITLSPPGVKIFVTLAIFFCFVETGRYKFAKNNRFLNVFLSLSNTFFVKQLVVSNWIHQESLTAKGVKKQKFVWKNFVPSHQRF